MRILVASNFFPPHIVGGAEIVANRHARGLQRRGHFVIAIGGSFPSPGRPPGSLEPEMQDGLPVERLALRSLDPALSFRWPGLARRLSALIALHGIEVVHLHNLVGLGVDSILAAKAAGARCVVTLHDHWGFCLRQSLLRPDGSLCRDHEECAVCLESFIHDDERLPVRLRRDFVAWSLEQADQLISPSAYLASAYGRAHVGEGDIEVLSNGIDLEAVPLPGAAPKGTDMQPAPLRFICSAHLGPHKGIGVLLDALQLLMADPALHGRWQLSLVGQGALREAADALATSAPAVAAGSPLLVMGHLPRAALLSSLAEADVVVLPSIWPENEPVTLLEGTAAGCALLVTRMGGAADMIEEGVTGLGVPPGDAAALAASMRRLIVEPGLAARLGAANLARRELLDERRAVERLEHIYAAPVAARPSPRSPVIMIGQGSASPEMIALVGSLHQHLPDGPPPRLLRHDWVPPQTWDEATLLWLWTGQGAQEAALQALRRDIPVVAPAGLGLERWAEAGAPVFLYNTPLEALAALQILLGNPAIRARLIRRNSLAADAVWAAPRDAFALRAERLGSN